MVVVDIPITIVATFFLSAAAFSIAVVTLLYMREIRKFVHFMFDSIVDSAMPKDDLTEYIQRQFVLLCNDDELFKKHIEKQLVDKNE